MFEVITRRDLTVASSKDLAVLDAHNLYFIKEMMRLM